LTGEFVLDASVILKWVLPSPRDEPDSDHALQLLRALRDGALAVVEPSHWLAEVAAVLVRRAPDAAEEAIGLLYAMELPVVADLDVYTRAARLAIETDQHVFDTLYHAVALARPDASLVTADERYYRAARRAGRLLRLADLP
jgi:predicted nucleic acid-binding protein